MLLFAAPLSVSSAAEWPEWRGGPERAGVWNEPGLPRTLPGEGPKILWSQTIGAGYSSPSVSGGRVYVLDRLKPPAAGADTERVLCFAAATGQPLWTNAYPCALKFKGGYENGPRATPTVRAGKVFTLGSMSDLRCLDAASGRTLWQHDLRAEYQARIPTWGTASAPWLEGSLVIVQAGGTNRTSVVAFDQDTGREVWRSLDDKPGYAAIVGLDVGATRQLIVWTAEAICSLNPKNGGVFWRLPRPLAWDQAIATPMYHAASGLLLISSDREGTIALKLDAAKPGYTVAWENLNLNSLHSNPVLAGDFVYGLNHNGRFKSECGEFRCVKIATGELQWAVTNVTRMGMHTHATVSRNAGNDTFYLTNELGELILASATPDGYHELARAQLTGKTWSHPAYANRRIYTRSETTLVCAGLE